MSSVLLAVQNLLLNKGKALSAVQLKGMLRQVLYCCVNTAFTGQAEAVDVDINFQS
jgi:hypothetical protein